MRTEPKKTHPKMKIELNIILPDKRDKREVLRSFHGSTIGGRHEVKTIYKNIKKQFKWHGMQQEIKRYIRRYER